MQKTLVNALDDGIKMCGSGAQLARQIGIAPQHLANARSGKRGLPAEAITKLAEVIDADARDLLVLDALARERDPVKRAQLQQRFFRHAGMTVALALSIILAAVSDDAKASTGAASQAISQSDHDIHWRGLVACRATVWRSCEHLPCLSCLSRRFVDPPPHPARISQATALFESIYTLCALAADKQIVPKHIRVP